MHFFKQLTALKCMCHYTFSILTRSVSDAEGGTFVFASNVLCIWNSLLMHVRTLLCSSIAYGPESDRFPT